jgi:hypothetical protein
MVGIPTASFNTQFQPTLPATPNAHTASFNANISFFGNPGGLYRSSLSSTQPNSSSNYDDDMSPTQPSSPGAILSSPGGMFTAFMRERAEQDADGDEDMPDTDIESAAGNEDEGSMWSVGGK